MKGRKHNIPMRMALVLLCLTMLTTHLTGGLYARYTTTATGSDGARVAKFDVQCNVTKDGDTDGLFKVTVKNTSEVTITYDLQVETEAGMPAMKAKFDDLTEGLTGDIFSNGNVWELTPGAEKNHSLQLGLKTLNDLSPRSTNWVETETVSLTFHINVLAEQLD